MKFRLLLVIITILYFLYDQVLITRLIINQRKKPLPELVSDIYDKERYQTFLDYKNEYLKLNSFNKMITLVLDILILLTPWYHCLDQLSNPYFISLMNIIIISFINTFINYFFSKYKTFTIEEKYGFNKKDHKEFLKDFFMDTMQETLLMVVLMVILCFIGEHIVKWTKGFTVSLTTYLMIGAGIVLVFFIFLVGATLVSLLVMRNTYQFTDMEDGELKRAIIEILSHCKKKIKRITVYNESKKSTNKNAFLMNVFNIYREISIADNFLNENDYDELLGVLSHEVGHLRHKKNIFNYLKYILFILFFVIIIIGMMNGNSLIQVIQYINDSFNITHTNYYLIVFIFTLVIEPFDKLISLYANYVSRREEKEADLFAVSQGYGEAIINMFKRLARDELVDINPHPLIEAMEHDHPSIAHRIEYLTEEMKK